MQPLKGKLRLRKDKFGPSYVTITKYLRLGTVQVAVPGSHILNITYFIIPSQHSEIMSPARTVLGAEACPGHSRHISLFIKSNS